jgi:hypothetical protein
MAGIIRSPAEGCSTVAQILSGYSAQASRDHVGELSLLSSFVSLRDVAYFWV